MKTFLTAISFFFAVSTFAQSKVVFEEDTVKYKGQKFYSGKEFMMSSGSGQDKTFQWVFVSDEKYSNVRPLYNVFANTKFTVEKIYNTHRGWSVQTRLPDLTKKDGKLIKGEVVFFVVDKAVDNKEVVIE